MVERSGFDLAVEMHLSYKTSYDSVAEKGLAGTRFGQFVDIGSLHG